MSPADTKAHRRHIPALDTVRGIAASVVLLGHCTLVYPLPRPVNLGLDMVLNQRAAVILFFVLSGYVLAKSWYASTGGVAELIRFFARRAFRLAPALWAVTLVAMAWLALYPPPVDLAHATPWAQAQYVSIPADRQFRAFLAIDNALVPPTWTITVEVIGSILLPFFAIAVARSRVSATVVLVLLGALAVGLAEASTRLSILSFMVYFAIGAVVAAHAHVTDDDRRARNLTWLGLGLIMLSRPAWQLATTGSLQPVEFRVNAVVPALGEGVGAALLVAGLAALSQTHRALNEGILRKLGDWSYSLYLVHFVVLRAGMVLIPSTLSPGLATVALTAFTVAGSVALAAISYRFVELPGIKLGKRLIPRATAPAPAA